MATLATCVSMEPGLHQTALRSWIRRVLAVSGARIMLRDHPRARREWDTVLLHRQRPVTNKCGTFPRSSRRSTEPPCGNEERSPHARAHQECMRRAEYGAGGWTCTHGHKWTRPSRTANRSPNGGPDPAARTPVPGLVAPIPFPQRLSFDRRATLLDRYPAS
jgi:hypothetical protein